MFLDDPPGYTASLRRVLKAFLTLNRGWHNPAPALNRLPHRCVHSRFGGSSYRYTMFRLPLFLREKGLARCMTHLAPAWVVRTTTRAQRDPCALTLRD